MPDGDKDVAKKVGTLTESARLEVAAYGFYYQAGTGQEPLGKVLESAVALGAPIIRVWAGAKPAAETYPGARQEVIDDLKRICDVAQAAKKTIALEWHTGTLTDRASSTKQLFEAVDDPGLKTYWQLRSHASCLECLEDMEGALLRLAGLHVFHWYPRTAERLPLADDAADWRNYLAKAAGASRGANPFFAFIEFVREEKPAQFLKDAETLNSLLADVNPASVI